MGFRFQRRIKIAPGLTINLSGSGVSTSLGVTGARYTIGHGKTRSTIGIPGSGMSFTSISGAAGKRAQPASSSSDAMVALGLVGAIVMLIVGPWQIALGLLVLISPGLAIFVLRRRTAPQPQPIQEAQPEPQADTWERFPFDLAELRGADGYYRIKYLNREGEESTRDIHVKRVYEFDGRFAIDAHCFLRNAHRHFLNDAITSCIDQETGESVPNLAEAAMAKFSTTPEGIIESAGAAMTEHAPFIDILTFVSRADGRMLPPERTVIAEAFKELTGSTIETTALSAALKVWEEPDLPDFKKSLAAFVGQVDARSLGILQRAAHAIVGTQVKVSAWEAAATAEIDAAAALVNQPQ